MIRLILELGIIRGIVFFIILILISAPVLMKGYAEPNVLSGLAFLSIISIHSHRKDKCFLQVVLKNDKLLYLTHYNIISIPVYLILLLSGNLFHLLFLIAAISAMSYSPMVSFLSTGSAAWTFWNIPIRNFELISGIRNYKIFILLLYSLAFVFYKYSYVALGVILLLTFITTLFYQEAESRQMLEVYKFSPQKFLSFKIKNQLLDYWIICLPLIVLFLIINAGYWYILLVFIVISSVIQALSIYLKYTFYEPDSNIDNGVFIGIYAISIIVPFFVPVPMVMLFYYYRRAISNLNNYLYDYS